MPIKLIRAELAVAEAYRSLFFSSARSNQVADQGNVRLEAEPPIAKRELNSCVIT